jgi:competence protein ComEA
VSEKPEKTTKNNLLQYLFVLLFGIGLSGLILFLNHRPKPQMIQILPTNTLSPLVVYVTGEVAKPGLYKLKHDARIADLINMAGGFTNIADEKVLNLAEFVYDGQQVIVPTMTNEGEQTDILTNPETTIPININHCTLEELLVLPGIGESKALAIINYREKNGNFEVKEDLMEVSGIGEVIFNSIKDLITVK